MSDPPPRTPPSRLAGLDRWMADDPWRPRVVPFFVWIGFLALTGFVPDAVAWLRPILYTGQIAIVAGLLWRYRRLTPELTLRWHWTVVPSALLLTAAWVGLGMGMVATGLPLVSDTMEPGERHPIQELDAFHPALPAVAMGLRLVGMAMIVPLFEELFIRSAMLRALHSWRGTKTGLLQLALDLPVVGDRLAHTDAGRAALAAPPAFTRQLVETPLHRITLFSVVASTVVFTASHVPRDYAGCVACGVVWCLMVGWTNRPGRDGKPLGLGPVVWSHALVNALLWGYTLYTGNWQFL